MSNENLLSSKVLSEHYLHFASTSGKPTESFSISTKNCEILSPFVDAEKVRTAKQEYLNSLLTDAPLKVAIVNVPMLIVYE